MKLLLFLDDWCLDTGSNITRRFAQAKPVPLDRRTAIAMARSSIIYDPDKRRYRSWSKKLTSTRAWQWESTDGVDWKRTKHSLRVHKDENFPFEQTWFHDPWDSNRERRYKMVLQPCLKGGPRTSALGFSSDGIHWKKHPECKWDWEPGNFSDTINVMFFNPFTKQWTIVCRKYLADRRVALTHSSDLEHWTEPEVVIHPDALDPSYLQFYGMCPTLYENEIFVGLFQCYQTPPEFGSDHEYMQRVKMAGSVQPQLTYSYDGRHWLRSDRTFTMPRPEPGEFGGSCIYPHAITPGTKDRLFVYSLGTTQDHGRYVEPTQAPREGMLVHTLRRDGFAYLESAGGIGYLATRTLIPKNGDLRLNYQAPAGRVLVQLSSPDWKPIPGFSFDDCMPLVGDEVRGKVRWKRRSNVKKLVGRPLRVEVKLLDARLYAVCLDCGLWYTCTKEPMDRI